MNNIFQLVYQQSIEHPDKVAIIYEDEQITYHELIEKVLILSAYFKSKGLTAGQRISLFAPNGPQYAIVLLSAAKLGLAVVPLPITLKGHALENAMKSIPVAVTVAWSSVSQQLLGAGLAQPENLITLNRCISREALWDDVIESNIKDDERVVVDTTELPFILTMTSGSTGSPKPIILTQECKIKRAFDATINYYKLTKDEVVLVSTPLYHSLAQRGLLMPLIMGATSVILPKFNVAKWFDVIEKYRVSFLFAVSSQLDMLVDNIELAKDMSSLNCVVSSSAVLALDTKEKLVKHFNCRLHECYGASEVGVVTDFCLNSHRDKQGSVGKALPFVKLKIIDEKSRLVGVGEVGQIMCQSKTEFAGYLKMPEKTKLAYDEQGYFATGDLGYLDEDGFLYYVGRNNDVISSGGINVYPQDIESTIKMHPDVEDCVAFAYPDKQFGEVIKVVYTTVSDTLDVNELKKLCLHELTDYQQPRYFERVDSLAKSSLGKILRQSVKSLFGGKG
ncbi:class I adenylate-forming enzyme family protein [Pseudoalteromonas sp. S16_S37]|uniref:class I adenylate-forming enzyme family protein n=1 Tax=Pseudoalteromonas sp. S16_S37 TaxID=2720228 RepID=UPI00168000A6|nr:class I adenylate-forming enzyme family protein [Pseudoalteromonas sp. S16_S37]MBD1582215.1 acyl--CoA ligase [Pseudoalteromonas sp. S16_S37]